MKKSHLLGAFSISLGMLISSAHGAFITNNSFLTSTTIDFSDQPNQSSVFGPIQIGDLVGSNVTVESSSDTNGLYFNYNGWGLLDNGSWGSPATYVGLNGISDTIIFAFNDGPVSGVGGFMNYAPPSSANLVITALGVGMNVLESYDITALADIVTPGGFNSGAFRGIQRSTADIYFFQVSGGQANVLDDLSFEAAAVPIPAAIWFFGSGLLGLLGMARHKKA